MSFVKGFGLGLPAEAVELLTMDANDVAQIAPPAQNGAEDIVDLNDCISTIPPDLRRTA
jgi:hypothetical protein